MSEGDANLRIGLLQPADAPAYRTLMLEAYGSRDVPVLEAAIVASGGLFVLTQALAGALHAAIDPRVGGSS